MGTGDHTIPDLAFRLLGYGGLGAVALLSLSSGNGPGLWLLIGYSLVWPCLWGWARQRWPDLRLPRTRLALLVHMVEAILVMTLVALAGFEFWIRLAVGLSLLSAFTALGGWRLFAPCMLIVLMVLILPMVDGGLMLQGRDSVAAEMTATAIGTGLLVFVLLLGLAGLSFRQALRLNNRRRKAVSESLTLRNQNARLQRYLPDGLKPLVKERPATVHRPTDHFATVAFIDIVGFTELVASRHLAELVDVVNDFISMMAELAERRGGIISKFLGDGVLVYFPEPDGACSAGRCRAAVQCARLCLDVKPGLRSLADCWLRDGLEVSLDTRAGISSGYCALGDWGGGARLDYTLIGTPVNLASRLQAVAATGGVLLSAPAAALLKEDPQMAHQVSAAIEVDLKSFGVCVVHELSGSAKVRAKRA